MAAKVNSTSAAVDAMAEDWDKIDTLAGGTAAMRRARTRFLPKFPREADDSYDYRVATSTLFNGLGRTIENMAAKPFTEAITHTDIDPVAEKWLENIDLCGNNLTVFGHNLMTAGLKYGLTHVLVENPITRDEDGEPLYKTKADEDSAGVRPYLVHIQPRQVLGWKSAKGPDGAEVSTQVRILECVEEDDGEFGTRIINQVRVLTPGAWATYRKNDKDEWLLHKEGVVSSTSIPLVTFYTRRTGFMTAAPPFRDLADLNIKHWQSSSDQDSILHTARVPLLALIGISEGDDVEIGPKSALVLPVGGDAKYVEHTGAAIDAGRLSLKDLEDQMRAMGGELLIQADVQSTATQNNIEEGDSKCQLQRMVEALEDTLDNALAIMHRSAKMEYKGSVDVFDDFAAGAVMQAAGPFMLALVQAVLNGIMSKEDAFAEMQRYGIVNQDLVWADVLDKIQAEPDVTPQLKAPAGAKA